MSSIPNFINFFTGYGKKPSDNASSDPSGYGFRFHSWDNHHKEGF